MFTLWVWNIIHAFYAGVSLYDHDQVAIYKKTLEDLKSRKRVGRKQYEYCGRPTLPQQTTKVERLLSTKDINLVSNNVCGKQNCVQLKGT